MPDVLRISEAASLAMHTMVLLAEDPERVLSTHDIATTLGVSGAHLSKVLQRLGRAGLVHSVRGPRGGFRPGKATDEITLLEVYEAIEGAITPRRCLLDKPICNGTGCILGDLLSTVNHRMRDTLGGARLSEVRKIMGSRDDQRQKDHQD